MRGRVVAYVFAAGVAMREVAALARGEDDGVIVDGRTAPTRLSRILADDGAAARVTVELTRMTFVDR